MSPTNEESAIMLRKSSRRATSQRKSSEITPAKKLRHVLMTPCEKLLNSKDEKEKGESCSFIEKGTSKSQLKSEKEDVVPPQSSLSSCVDIFFETLSRPPPPSGECFKSKEEESKKTDRTSLSSSVKIVQKKAKRPKTKSSRDHNKPRKNSNAFFLFFDAQRKVILQKHPDLAWYEVRDKITELYSDLPQDQLKSLKDRAAKLGKEHVKRIDEYRNGKKKLLADKNVKEKQKKRQRGKTSNISHNKTARDPLRPKRPMNAYLLYTQTKMGEMRAQNPNMPYSEVREKVLQMYNDLPYSERQALQAQSKENGKKYAQRMKEYKGLKIEEKKGTVKEKKGRENRCETEMHDKLAGLHNSQKDTGLTCSEKDVDYFEDDNPKHKGGIFFKDNNLKQTGKNISKAVPSLKSSNINKEVYSKQKGNIEKDQKDKQDGIVTAEFNGGFENHAHNSSKTTAGARNPSGNAPRFPQSKKKTCRKKLSLPLNRPLLGPCLLCNSSVTSCDFNKLICCLPDNGKVCPLGSWYHQHCHVPPVFIAPRPRDGWKCLACSIGIKQQPFNQTSSSSIRSKKQTSLNVWKNFYLTPNAQQFKIPYLMKELKRVKSTIDSTLTTLRKSEDMERTYLDDRQVQKELSSGSRPPVTLVSAQLQIVTCKTKIRNILRSLKKYVGSCHPSLPDPRFDNPHSSHDNDSIDVSDILCTVCHSGEASDGNDIFLCDGKG
uniref:HMG box domain-containing protein n=2 Tax=Corethron hystrix TaxID=216773 RepID=A0A7S1BZM3_9STRA|mmetsp:Transcript_5667/g.11890  ORF Transcript_5667/g.11890 Transcript_5667/m.11890 type:complete len:716 (+) Transcript_5667:498-2645(+)